MPGLLAVLVVGFLVMLFSEPARFIEHYRASADLHFAKNFNQPTAYDHLGGIPFLSSNVPGWGVIVLLAGAAIATSVALGDRRRLAGEKLRNGFAVIASGLLVMIAASVALMPLHQYDWVLLTPALLLFRRIRAEAFLIGVAFACILILGRIGLWRGWLSSLGLSDGDRILQFSGLAALLAVSILIRNYSRQRDGFVKPAGSSAGVVGAKQG